MPPKLLLADDSLTVQRVIALTFQGEGIDVVAVGDGDQAVEAVERERPEILLADLSMPGRDGYAVAEHVKRAPHLLEQTRVVLLTGAFEPVDEGRSRALGIDGVLAKPFEPQVAIALVKRLLAEPPIRPMAAESGWTAGGTDRTTAFAGGAMSTGPAYTSEIAAGYPFDAPQPGGAGTSVALDDYLRRLDEAIARAGGGTPHHAAVRAGGSAAGIDHGPDDETAVVPRPAFGQPHGASGEHAGGFEAADSFSSRGEPVHASGAEGGAPVAGVSLVDAFTALLAAEEARGDAPVTQLAAAPAAVAPEVDVQALADRVTPLVIERISDSRIRDAVARVVADRVTEIAERLVREEIEWIKAEAGS